MNNTHELALKKFRKELKKAIYDSNEKTIKIGKSVIYQDDFETDLMELIGRKRSVVLS